LRHVYRRSRARRGHGGPSVCGAFLASQQQQSGGQFIRSYITRLRGGDLGQLPILVGIIIIAIVFQRANSHFLTARNFVNLVQQMAAYASIAYGVVFVLLLGEIDLSVGFVSAVVGVVMTLAIRPPTTTTWLEAIAIGLAAGAAIGVLHGIIITFFQVPSFVVTLAGLLAWNGVVLLLVGGGGTVIIQDAVINGIDNAFLPTWLGWLFAAIFIVGYAAGKIRQVQSRSAKGLASTPWLVVIIQVVFFAVIVSAVVVIANSDRGVPVAGVLIMALLVVLSFIAENTRFGRYVYAIGGNKEAARRAGIKVEQIRVLVFMISSLMAGVGGIVVASQLGSVATESGGGQLLLNCIASAVIGGTSLFGGRGKVSNALLGALVVAGVENGMGLLGLSAGIKYIVTGLVLLAAVLIDALSRRSQRQSGIA